MARFVKGQIPWNKGMTGYRKGHLVSLLTRQKISIANTKLDPKTPKNQLIRKSTQYKEWRQSVFQRDKFQCQRCGSSKDLHPHHIKYFSLFPELRFDINNGLTLCSICHGKEHNINFSKSGTYLTCEVCKIRFRPKGGHLKQKTCGKKCQYQLISSRPSKLKGRIRPDLRRARIGYCLECSTEYRAVSDYTKHKQKFCSHACYLKNRWNFTGEKAKLL